MNHRLLLAILLLSLGLGVAHAQEPVWRHATSLNEEPKYPADFKHFDYVNPDAPKEGVVDFTTTAASTRSIRSRRREYRGPARHQSTKRLMTSASTRSRQCTADRRAKTYPDDYASVTFRLRPKPSGTTASRSRRGRRVVVPKLIELNPPQKFIKMSQGGGDGRATSDFTFDQTATASFRNRGPVIVLPKHWGKGPTQRQAAQDRQRHSRTAARFGPYRVTASSPARPSPQACRGLVAKDLPSRSARIISTRFATEIFLDETVEFELQAALRLARRELRQTLGDAIRLSAARRASS